MLSDFRAKERARISVLRNPPSYKAVPAKIESENKYWLEKIKKLPDVRQEKVQSIREALDSGQYDLEARLEKVFDHLPEALSNLAPPKE